MFKDTIQSFKSIGPAYKSASWSHIGSQVLTTALISAGGGAVGYLLGRFRSKAEDPKVRHAEGVAKAKSFALTALGSAIGSAIGSTTVRYEGYTAGCRDGHTAGYLHGINGDPLDAVEAEMAAEAAKAS